MKQHITPHSPGQIAPLGLLAKQQFRADIEPYFARLSDEEERLLLERVRAGESGARDQLILSLQRQVYLLASRYADQDPDRYLDLVQEANVALLETLEQALSKSNPCSYLMCAVRSTMIDWITGNNDLIRKKSWRNERIPVQSLDVPIDGEGKLFHEILPAPDLSLSVTPDAYERVRQAVRALPEADRSLIERHYGFSGEAESFHTMSQELTEAHTRALTRSGKRTYLFRHNRRALTQLRALLASAYPQYHQVSPGASAGQRNGGDAA
jgi:RNA polymerase sigma factor (sigma-70 family)